MVFYGYLWLKGLKFKCQGSPELCRAGGKHDASMDTVQPLNKYLHNINVKLSTLGHRIDFRCGACCMIEISVECCDEQTEAQEQNLQLR